MEQKKKLIILGTLIVIFVILALCFWPQTKTDNITIGETKKNVENTYTMYVRINPLVKLVYKESYVMCKKENGLEYVCSSKENTVTSYELLNEDAENFYQYIDYTNKDILEALISICDIARDNEVAFSSFEIITDNLQLDTNEIKEQIKENSKYAIEYEVYVQYEEFLNEQEIIEDSVTKFKVEFDAGENHPSNQTVLVKANESVLEPETPTKDGYVFVEWQYNGKAFDFTTSINKDITLIAIWKENPVKTTTTTTSTTTKKTTTTTTTTTTKKVSTITSTIDKINLNDNILVYEIETGVYPICNPRYYIFSSNVADQLSLFQDKSNKYSYLLDNGVDESKCTSYDVDATEHNECIQSQCNSLYSTYAIALTNLQYNETLESSASEKLKAIKERTIIGVTNFEYTDETHRFTYQYKALMLSSNQDLDTFATAYNNNYNSFVNELNTIFKEGSIIDESCNGACGIGPGSTVLLTESLCNTYNLTCDKW